MFKSYFQILVIMIKMEFIGSSWRLGVINNIISKTQRFVKMIMIIVMKWRAYATSRRVDFLFILFKIIK